MHRLTLFFTVGVAQVIALGGCSNFTSPARSHELDSSKAYWFDYDASRRGAVSYPSDANVKTCAEPSPDVALSFVSSIEASAKSEAGKEAGGKGELNATIVELAKRTQMVMFLRESLYRLCEQSLNGNIGKDDVPIIYDKIISTASDLAKSDQANAQAKAQEAESKVLEIKKQMQN
jgi:hypothetical protein